MPHKITEERRLEIARDWRPGMSMAEADEVGKKHGVSRFTVVRFGRAMRAGFDRAAAADQKNGKPVSLSVVDQSRDLMARVKQLQSANAQLQWERDHALEEVETLQKLLMTVGRTL